VVRAATVAAVGERLPGVVSPEQVSWRVAETLRRRLAEAVFAHAVLLVEGATDGAVYRGIADQDPVISLDAAGVAVVAAGGKKLLPLLWAILVELGIPVYVVFDGDAGTGDRMRAAGNKPDQQVAAAVTQAEEDNRLLLRLLGEPETAWPPPRSPPGTPRSTTSLSRSSPTPGRKCSGAPPTSPTPRLAQTPRTRTATTRPPCRRPARPASRRTSSPPPARRMRKVGRGLRAAHSLTITR
jgi:hypothetical protein